jgi:hypothetical protein
MQLAITLLMFGVHVCVNVFNSSDSDKVSNDFCWCQSLSVLNQLQSE